MGAQQVAEIPTSPPQPEPLAARAAAAQAVAAQAVAAQAVAAQAVAAQAVAAQAAAVVEPKYTLRPRCLQVCNRQFRWRLKFTTPHLPDLLTSIECHY
jgi:hypothetical protein